ncbi:pyridoxal phosphate-dependent transferase [Schizothecium vesticola]|uniref:histidinol-phosphate transaminase n=1 Tax=Schizothecium vesticola TaxID=314040 RepID=A0AA40ERG0_9PEZI|nr:pyridoxal phosphate-dependent transferase [Schizothecium vesticola]
MSPFNLETCCRPNILALEPYRCARDDYKDDGTNILLDANENAFGPPLPSSPGPSGTGPGPSLDLDTLHRYPDPHQPALKSALCALRNTHAHTPLALTPANLFLGVGSDEAIDALLRAFCRPGLDRILVCPPTYGMYSVSAQINDVSLVKVPLLPGPTFSLDLPAILSLLSSPTESPTIKLLYLCSPGNPTGSLLSKPDIAALLAHPTWNGLVVVDEAYVDFATAGESASLAEWVLEFPNLVVMQTLSKAFGLAGIRLGAAFAAEPVARVLNNLKAPYNISSPTAAVAEYALSPAGLEAMRRNRGALVAQRERLVRELGGVEGMLDAGGRPSNEVAVGVYERLAEEKGVVVRFRGREVGCEGCLRITVGTEEENTRMLGALRAALGEVRGVRG